MVIDGFMSFPPKLYINGMEIPNVISYSADIEHGEFDIKIEFSVTDEFRDHISDWNTLKIKKE